MSPMLSHHGRLVSLFLLVSDRQPAGAVAAAVPRWLQAAHPRAQSRARRPEEGPACGEIAGVSAAGEWWTSLVQGELPS